MFARAVAVARAAAPAMRVAAPSRAMATGTVKWFNIKKGFGFITPDDGTNPEVFAHHSAVQSSGFRYLQDGEKVKFDLQQTDRGVQAVNITTPEGTPFNRPPPPAREGGEDRPRREFRPRREGGEDRPRREYRPRRDDGGAGEA